MREIRYSKQAWRALCAMPANTAGRIKSKLEAYAENPASQANNVKAMRGDEFAGCYRLRIGDWRVVFSDDGVILAIEEIASRGTIY